MLKIGSSPNGITDERSGNHRESMVVLVITGILWDFATKPATGYFRLFPFK